MRTERAAGGATITAVKSPSAALPVNKVHGRHRLAISKQPFWPNRVQLELEFSRLEECSTECRQSGWNVRNNFPDNTRPWLSFPQGLNTGDYQVAGGMPRVPAVFLTCYVVSSNLHSAHCSQITKPKSRGVGRAPSLVDAFHSQVVVGC